MVLNLVLYVAERRTLPLHVHACSLPYKHVESSILCVQTMGGIRAPRQKKADNGNFLLGLCITLARSKRGTNCISGELLSTTKPQETSGSVISDFGLLARASKPLQSWAVRARDPVCLGWDIPQVCTWSLCERHVWCVRPGSDLLRGADQLYAERAKRLGWDTAASLHLCRGAALPLPGVSGLRDPEKPKRSLPGEADHRSK